MPEICVPCGVYRDRKWLLYSNPGRWAGAAALRPDAEEHVPAGFAESRLADFDRDSGRCRGIEHGTYPVAGQSNRAALLQPCEVDGFRTEDGSNFDGRVVRKLEENRRCRPGANWPAFGFYLEDGAA